MASEPQPPTIHEGATSTTVPAVPAAAVDADADDEQQPAESANKSAEERRTAAALSTLEDAGADEEAGTRGGTAADREALGKAMSRLEVQDRDDVGGKGKGKGKGAEKKVGAGTGVKVDAEDVGLLVSFSCLGLEWIGVVGCWGMRRTEVRVGEGVGVVKDKSDGVVEGA